jgi:hypothetical protein
MNNKSHNKRRLVLHIGTHKTGSTTLQHLCWRNRDQLLKSGWLYPSNGRPKHGFRPGHHYLSFGLAEGSAAQRPDWAKQITTDDIVDEWKKLMEEISGYPDKNIVLSSEAIGICKENAIRIIKDFTSDFTVTVVIYLRNPLSYLISSYKQRVKKTGYTGNFREYAEKIISGGFYSGILERWSAVFGKDNINIRLYDKVCNSSGLVYDFFKILDLPESVIRTLPRDLRLNVSPNDNTIYILRVINRTIKFISNFLPEGHKIKPIRYVRNSKMSNFLDSISTMGGKHLLASQEDIDWLRGSLLRKNTITLPDYIESEVGEYLKF